jgi:hypothetical protein
MPAAISLIAQVGRSILLLSLGLASLTLPVRERRRRALAGNLVLILAIASSAVLGQDSGGASGPVSLAHSMTIGVALLGLMVVMIQGSAAGLSWWVLGPLGGLGLVLLAAGVPMEQLPSRWGVASLTGVGLALAFLLARFVLRPFRIGDGVRWLDRRLLRRRAEAAPRLVWDASPRTLLALHAVGTGVALTAGHLHLFCFGLLTALVSGELLTRRLAGDSRWPVPSAVTSLAIGGSWYLLVHVAGDQPLWLDRLRDAPYSPAFEFGTSLLLALVAWRMMGLWPFDGSLQGPFSALAGGALLVRLIGPDLAAGLAHWQPLFYLLAAVAAWHAALSRTDREAVAALGALGVLTGDPSAGWAGVLLLAGTVGLQLIRYLVLGGRILNQRGRLTFRLTVVLGLMMVLPVLEGGLLVQVFYSVTTVAGVVAALWNGAPAEPIGRPL